MTTSSWQKEKWEGNFWQKQLIKWDNGIEARKCKLFSMTIGITTAGAQHLLWLWLMRETKPVRNSSWMTLYSMLRNYKITFTQMERQNFLNFIYLFICFTFWLCSMWDLISLTRDWTCALCSRSTVLATGPSRKSPRYFRKTFLMEMLAFITKKWWSQGEEFTCKCLQEL